ncbi:dihydrolipoamide branched chain transacylase, E2 subunit, putative [Eimeria necatrix]|uniref:Dihydrolipoamide acetyltransferase component of pyruvate dehydrogenase complex n=1 Tax=Eimeria necatrix TaxID=51315 RepID=U6MSE1_9EIME|nr:dihydrolipoamide branched chain transacylase, E2 subunit, putative [Eimeria necatrix]CDJ67112.1 dihydrolipoamide branched chain transacylase, E2 subunit, putative [Eimeria necatrix]
MAFAARSLGRIAAAASSHSPIGKCSTWLSPAAAVSLRLRQEGLGSSASTRGLFTVSHPRHGIVCFKLADIGEGIASVELTKWYKKTGDTVEEMEEVCEVQSDKAAVEITSRYSGKIVKLYAKEGDTVKIGAPLIDIDSPDVEETQSQPPSPAAPPPSEASKPQQPSAAASSSKGAEALASPAVRRFAKEKGVNLEAVKGTGARGAITKEDVLNYLSSGASEPQSSAGEDNSGAAQSPPAPRQSRGNREVVLQGFSKAMVKSMTDSLKVPHMNIGDEYDITRLTELRHALNKELASQNIRISLTAFLIKAISLAINEYPIVNSKFNTETQNSYTEFGSHNVSVAIDSPGGLVVPCVKNVQDLTLVEIQRELVRLQGLAKANRLSPADLTGGTIALSNVGVISGDWRALRLQQGLGFRV